MSGCPKSDAVLAIFLDGDVDADATGFGFARQDALAEHLRDCGECHRLLQRARRLDAALAEQAGREFCRHVGGAGLATLGDRWFAAVAAAAAPAPVPAPRPAVSIPAPAGRGALALACTVGGLLIGLAWAAGHSHPTAPATPPAAAHPVAPVPAAAKPFAGIAVAADAPRRRSPAAAASTPQPAAVAEAILAAPQVLADPHAPSGERLAAAKQLLATGQASSVLRVLAAGTASAERPDDLATLRDGLRQAPALQSTLRSLLQRLDRPRGAPDLDELAAFTVAAQAGERDLDLQVLRALRRRPELGPALGAALRGGARRQGAGELLLSAWHEQAERGGAADDERAAAAWFCGQPAACFDEVHDALGATRSAPRRIRCLLALGFSPTPRHVDTLVAAATSGNRQEAVAAAFALALGDPRWLRPLLPRAGQEREFLLRAALVRAGLAEAAPFLDALALDPGERRLAAGCSFADFPGVAAWFRERTAASD